MNLAFEGLYGYLDAIGVPLYDSIAVLEDRVEVAGRHFENGKYILTFPYLVETGYRIAKVSLKGSVYTIKYSPELSDGLYPYGSLSDIYNDEIENLVKQEVLTLSEECIQDVAVVVEERLWSGEVLQCFSTGLSIPEAVPQTGMLNIQIVFNDAVGQSFVAELLELASARFADVEATVLLDGIYHAGGVAEPRLLHLYWKDGAELKL